MSYQEIRIGKMKLIYSGEKENIEEWLKHKCKNDGFNELSEYHSTWKNYAKEIYYKEFLILDTEIFKIIENEELSDDVEILYVEKNKDVYNFVLQWNNGGASFDDILEEALEKKRNRGLL